PADRMEGAALTALINLRPDASPMDQAEGVKQLPDLLGVPGAPRQAALCVALAELARQKPKVRPAAAPLLRKGFAAFTDPADKKRVGDLMALLYGDALAEAEAKLKDKNFPATHAALADADALALDAAAQAEIDALRALAWLQEPGQQQKALDLVARLVAQAN